MNDTLPLLSLLVSVIGVVIAMVSLVRTRRTAQRQLELEQWTADLAKKQLEQMAAEETAHNRAEIAVSLQGKSPFYSLVVRNVGQSEARDVRLVLGASEDAIRLIDGERDLPITNLRPGNEKHLRTWKAPEVTAPVEATVNWLNVDSSRGKSSIWVSM